MTDNHAKPTIMTVGKGVTVPALEVDTPMGKLIAYPSTDPMFPGIFIDLKRDGADFTLNLAGTECEAGQNGEPHTLTSHIWGDAIQENATHNIGHINIDRYFNGEN